MICTFKKYTKLIDDWILQYNITRFLTSYSGVAFFYGIFLFLYELKFLRDIIPAIHPVLIFWAGFVAVYNVLIRKSFTEWPHWIPIICFGVFVGITSVINFETGIVQNIKAFIFVMLPLATFYPVCLNTSKKKREDTVVKILLGAAVVVFLASTIALILYMLRISYAVDFIGKKEVIGIRLYDPSNENSGVLLYGLYVDTNHAAVYAMIFAMYSVLLYRACKQGLFSKKWKNLLGCIFAVINFIVQIGYFPLANSRGAWLCLCVACVIVLFLYFYQDRFAKKELLLRIMTSGVLSIACMLLLAFVLIGVRTGESKLSVVIQKEFMNNTLIKENTEMNFEDMDEVDSVDSFEKQNAEFGAGRIQIWKEVPELLAKKPILGTGFGNHQYYAEKYNVGQVKIVKGAALHNSYLELLLSYGVVGTIALMSFFILSAKTVLQKIFFDYKSVSMSYLCIVFIILILAGQALLLSNIFINTTAMYYAMLIMLGYLVADKNSVEKLE